MSMSTETTEMMIAAQIAVQKNSSMVRLSVSASVISRRAALTINAKSPSVITVNGNVTMRKIVPISALTIPKSAETQKYAQNPPETSIPERSQLVTAKAAATVAHRINNAVSIVLDHIGECESRAASESDVQLRRSRQSPP